MIRKAEPKDAEAIGRVRVAAWRAAYPKFMPAAYLDNLNPLEKLAELSNRLASQIPAFTVSVAEVRGSVAAFCIVGKPRFPAVESTIELWALNVMPGYWRQGLGSSLVSRAIEGAGKAGFARLELWCLAGNEPALRAYEKAGFCQSGRERSSSELTGNMLHEVHMVRKIDVYFNRPQTSGN